MGLNSRTFKITMGQVNRDKKQQAEKKCGAWRRRLKNVTRGTETVSRGSWRPSTPSPNKCLIPLFPVRPLTGDIIEEIV